ncbi:MAG: cytochrome-c peroxidase [Myxococcales bacterium]|nr:cytochrome-c peroxidase [Myxococcales bacterium]
MARLARLPGAGLVLLCFMWIAPALAQVRHEPITAIPPPPALDPLKISLGQRLFNDPRLSGDGTIACASCHPLALGGADRLARSRGVGGKQGLVNTPTVLNAALQFRQFWNGRAANLREQVGSPLVNPVEMGSSWSHALSVIEADPSYQSAFVKAYGRVTETAVRDALAVFQETLLTPDSAFDRWLGGDDKALSADALEGYRRFKALGCISCHQGVLVGGNMFQTFGIMGDYFGDRGQVTESDLGRQVVTGREEDRHRFKVPSLRNVALTPPYFHDGTAATLADAVRVMARYQLGVVPSDEDVRVVVAFLESLTGRLAGEPLR